ncbi:MAG: GDP-mannose 4,6-dehydratase [Candidatus Omnitrophica bacterium]|nr:GDP-mannose 4,6-dehydratase [Candidatus Omnitrophota bacterium]
MDKKFWEQKKVLITGHIGFLGSWLTNTLLELGANVVGVDIVKSRKGSVLIAKSKNFNGVKADVANLKFLTKIISTNKPQIIFHLAAEAIVSRANNNPIRTFKSNIQGTWNILEAARNKDFIEAIVVASSDKAYGAHKKLPYKETAPLKGDHPYDASKSCADLLAYTYFHTYGVPVCVTRCGNIFGPGDSNLSRIVPDAMRCVLTNKKLLIRSDGKFTRDYVYVEDIVKGYVLLAQKMKKRKLAGEAFNFSDENPISVLDLVEKIYKIAGKKPDYQILNTAKYEIKHQYLASQKARRVLGWKPMCTLDEGIKRTISWYSNLHNKK